uniref:Uncharacterized protein n=1 Tax=Romanomermis culicivorax TaxID=13658 RepID=A0A915JKL4_ROMCU
KELTLPSKDRKCGQESYQCKEKVAERLASKEKKHKNDRDELEQRKRKEYEAKQRKEERDGLEDQRRAEERDDRKSRKSWSRRCTIINMIIAWTCPMLAKHG